MFKKAKRCNFRRRNDSDDEEKEEVPDEPSQEVVQPQPQPCGPAGDSSHTPAAQTPPAVNALNSLGNGVQTGTMRLPKDKKKKKDSSKEEPKASLLSFNDEEGIR